MGRGKLSMELIKKEKTRMVTYQKRKKGLMKKAYEFSTLCNVDACVIVLGPKLNDAASPEVETWPKNSDQVRAIIKKYRSSEIPNIRRKKTQHLSDFFAVRKIKVEKEIEALRKENMEAMFTRWDARLEHWSPEKLRVLGAEFEAKLAAANERYLVFKIEEDLANQQHQMNLVKQQLQKAMELDALQKQQQQQQNISYVKPLFNMSIPAFYNPIDQAALLRLPFGFPNNHNNSTMMMMPTKGEDIPHFHGNTSTGFIPFTPLTASSAYYDPTIENMMFNNPRPLSVSDYCPAPHPMQFYGQNLMSVPNAACPQMQAPQFSDFHILNEHGMDNRRNNF
ncbi:agamous-like MADS-box protein AGL19 [Tripterygium wilfordii]|uniref:Agamous-like MADS-box protein AGL19 n=1 Tax=Tripterygium wilfordii TaxID=458696 RepID=A0A7J7C3D0_TRIWF|nr:agamous-like MADS-box protein AGL21 [Tripterygium wilfordii]KAF5728266.1 agamous-like MADS-box protein AGL19 [Tripterygium wilfordii]